MRSDHNPTVCVGSYYFQWDRKGQSEKHSRPQAGMGREGVGWRTGRGELEYLTCSQVEEGGGVGLGLLVRGLGWKAAAA